MNIAVNTDILSSTGDPEMVLRLIAEAGFTHLHWCHHWVYIMDIVKLVSSQREFFSSGKTLDYEFRINALKKLKKVILEKQDKITQALKADLGKSAYESFMCEIGLTISEITFMIKHLKKFMKPKKVSSNLSQFPSKCKVIPVPYGVTLIMSPWNYPFMLAMEPLVDSLASGNTAIGAYTKRSCNQRKRA